MRKKRSRPLLLFFAVAMAVLVPATIALSQGVVGERETRIITGIGGSPIENKATDTTPFDFDGSESRTDPLVGTERPMDNVTFSQDNRKIRYLAWSTGATNLVAGDTNGKLDVILMKRAGRFDGKLSLGSVSSSEKQGNGDSIKPSIDGQTYGKGAREKLPHCLTFQSTATNLDSGDKSDDWDVFLRDFKHGTTKLVSEGKTNARDAVVDGECRTITYEAGGTVYVYDIAGDETISVGKGKHPDQQTDGKGVAYDKEAGGHRQVYWQGFDFTARRGLQKIGRAKLASNTKGGGFGNGDSTDPSMNDNGDYVAFESTATNLCTDRCQGVSEDRNGSKKDVFRRTLKNRAPAGKGPSGNGNEMQMISYDGTIDLQADEPSDQVQLTGAGEQACFRSFGKNAREAKFDRDEQVGPFMHIYFWNFPRERRIGKFSGESKAGRTGEFTRKPGGSGIAAYNWSCAISNRGNFIAFSSDEEEESGEKNGTAIPDLFLRFMGGSDEGLDGDF